MKESFTTNTSELIPSDSEHRGPIVFDMSQLPEQPATPVEAPISTQIQPEVGEVPTVAANAPKESPVEDRVIDLDKDPENTPFQQEVAGSSVRETVSMARSETIQTVESGPILAKGYERIGKFGEKVKGWKGKLLQLGGTLLRGAGKILKGTFKLAKAGLATLVSPDVLMKRGAKSVAEFGTSVKNVAVQKTTESYGYARDSFFEAWGGLKAKGNSAVEGAKNKVTDLWKGMVAMKTEILLKSLDKKRQQAAAQEDAARTTKEAFEAQMAAKMKLLESLRGVTPKKAEDDYELALAA